MAGPVTLRSGATVRDCVDVLDAAYDPALAFDWDTVGLALGDPGAGVSRVLLAVDPTPAVAAEAIASRTDLLVTHHPLWLRGTTSVTTESATGRVAGDLLRAGIALHTAHTNADVARPGVTDALAIALGLGGELPALIPGRREQHLLVHVYVPPEDRVAVLSAMHAAGAGAVGRYADCGYWTSGTGQFRPLAGASPHTGDIGASTEVAEDRVEVVCGRDHLDAVVAALESAHPYELPAYGITAIEGVSRFGLGRVGDLALPEDFEQFVGLVRAALPQTAVGVRGASPDPGKQVRRVAVLAGAGDSEITAVLACGADTYVTSDLRHHHTRDAIDAGLAVVDVPHWAAEWPWLAQAANVLREGLAERGFTVDIVQSRLVTDPWCTLSR